MGPWKHHFPKFLEVERKAFAPEVLQPTGLKAKFSRPRFCMVCKLTMGFTFFKG